jgi:hypothetical protein
VHSLYEQDLRQYERRLKLKKESGVHDVGAVRVDDIDRLLGEWRTDLFIEKRK